jgi:hypothetical protein
VSPPRSCRWRTEDRRAGGEWSPGGRISRAGHRVDDQPAIVIGGNLYAGLGAGVDERIDMALDLFLDIAHRCPVTSPAAAAIALRRLEVCVGQ